AIGNIERGAQGLQGPQIALLTVVDPILDPNGFAHKVLNLCVGKREVDKWLEIVGELCLIYEGRPQVGRTDVIGIFVKWGHEWIQPGIMWAIDPSSVIQAYGMFAFS